MRTRSFISLAILLCATVARADVVKNISTGWDNGAGAVIDASQPDPDYTISPGDLTATVLPEAFPIPPWFANSDTSKWIGFDVESSNAEPIVYDFETTVSMDGFDPETATVSGQWSTDNVGQDILVNGVSTGISNDGNFGALHDFSVPTGFFQAGDNDIVFRFENAPPGANPAGLRVEAAVEAAVIPEPASILILVMGFGGIAASRRRSRTH